ncbi:MAG TPA: metallophosphoesterase family protein [Actinomycetota bacterium]
MAERRFLERLARLAVPALIGMVGAWLALLMAGRHDYDLGPFRVEFFGRPGSSATELALPPFGRLQADTHLAPLKLSATLQEVAAVELGDIVQHKGVGGLTLEIEEEAPGVLVSYVLRSLAVVLAGAAVAALLVFRARWRPVIVAVVTSGLVFGGMAGISWLTFRPEAFLSPTFSGSLALAPRLVGPIRDAGGRIEDFRAELERLVGGAVSAYTTIAATPPTTGADIVALHISDVHLSPLGMDFAQRLASSFEVDLVLDTGDLTSFGSSLEQGITSRIREFGVPYVFVRGNHDSALTVNEVLAQPNAIVLRHELREVAGLRIYGAPHPLFTPALERDYPGEEIEETLLAVGEVVSEEVSAASPDLLVVHDDRMAEASIGLVPVVASGHFHQTTARVVEGTILLRVGTTGAGGLDTFTAPQPIPLSAQLLYFDGDPVQLVAWDTVLLDPITRDLTVRRHLPTEIGEEEEPAPQGEPAPTP